MRILGIESATAIASVAIIDEKGLLGEINLNLGFTHSEELLPAIDELLKLARLSLKDIDAIAVSGGPGSFTGLRIGMSTAKALAQGQNKKFFVIPGLLAQARAIMDSNYLVVPVENARKKQVYGAIYNWKNNNDEENRSVGKKDRIYADFNNEYEISELISPGAFALEELAEIIKATCEKENKKAVLLGDGYTAYAKDWQEALGNLMVSVPSYLSIPKASYVAFEAMKRYINQDFDDIFTTDLTYIRGI